MPTITKPPCIAQPVVREHPTFITEQVQLQIAPSTIPAKLQSGKGHHQRYPQCRQPPQTWIPDSRQPAAIPLMPIPAGSLSKYQAYKFRRIYCFFCPLFFLYQRYWQKVPLSFLTLIPYLFSQNKKTSKEGESYGGEKYLAVDDTVSLQAG